MADLEDTGGGRAAGRGRPVGYQRYPLPDDLADQGSLFLPLESPIEIGTAGRPTGVKLEDLVVSGSSVQESGWRRSRA
ncbi:hypothetical protein ACWGIU_23250 [Streptomyces sp. NPDC054840]